MTQEQGNGQKKNENLIKRQIDLYAPSIVIAGGTLKHFLPCKSYKSKIREHINKNSGIDILGHHINIDDYSLDYNNNYAFWNDKILFIAADHPAYGKDIKEYSNSILDLINKYRPAKTL